MDTYERTDGNVHTHLGSAHESKRGICLLCLAYFTWCNYLQFHPFCLQMAQVLSSLPLNKIPLCTYTTFISAAGHLERFHILVTVNTAAINMDVQAFPGVLSSIQWNSWIIRHLPFVVCLFGTRTALWFMLTLNFQSAPRWPWTCSDPPAAVFWVLKAMTSSFCFQLLQIPYVLFPGAYYNQT